MACTFFMLPHGLGSSSEYCLICELWLLQLYALKAVHSGIPASMTSIMAIMTCTPSVSCSSSFLLLGCLVLRGRSPTLPWMPSPGPAVLALTIRMHPGLSTDCISLRLSPSTWLLPTCLGIHPWLSMPISISTSPAGLASLFLKPLACRSLLSMSVSASVATKVVMRYTPITFTLRTLTSLSRAG